MRSFPPPLAPIGRWAPSPARGVLEREVDEGDRRRTLLLIPEDARTKFGADRGRRDIREAVHAWLAGQERPCRTEDVNEVVASLEQLAERLNVGTSSSLARRPINRPPVGRSAPRA